MEKRNKLTIAAMAKRSDIYLGASIILSSNLWFSSDNLLTTIIHLSMLLLIIYFTINIIFTHYNIFKLIEETESKSHKSMQNFALNVLLYFAAISVSLFFVNNKEASNYTVSLWLILPLLISLPLFITHAKVSKPTTNE